MSEAQGENKKIGPRKATSHTPLTSTPVRGEGPTEKRGGTRESPCAHKRARWLELGGGSSYEVATQTPLKIGV